MKFSYTVYNSKTKLKVYLPGVLKTGAQIFAWNPGGT